MKYISLGKNNIVIIDDEDYGLVSQYRWHLSSGGYAVRTTHAYIDGVRKTYHPSMHQLINGTPIGRVTDHINGNRLDNRRNNLRTCTQSQNMSNRGKQKNNTSGYKGVRWQANRWRAYITAGGIRIYLGASPDIKKAAQLYNQAAVELFGKYAKENES